MAVTDYDVHGHTELADAIRDGASVSDSMRVLGTLAVPRAVPELAYRVERDGRRVDEVGAPARYTWLGQEIADRTGITSVTDLQSWDVLDAIAPDDPLVWAALKYLTRLGRKGDSSRRIVDLRKAAAYLERAIEAEARHGDE